MVLAKSYAEQTGCMERVFFTGGFLQENPLARLLIAQSMTSVGGRAIFCRHAQFLGALGSLATSGELQSQGVDATPGCIGTPTP